MAFSAHLPAANFYCDAVSTGSLRLDTALGTGGLPRGWITEIFGPESSGKSTLILHTLASAQEQGGLCALIDSDHALDPRYARSCGIDPDRLYLCEPADAEQALSICASLLKSASFAAIAIDSATSLLPLEEQALDYGASFASIQSQLLNRAVPRLAALARRSGTALLVSDQLRMRPEKIYHQQPASTAVLALKLHAAVRLELHPAENLHTAASSQMNIKVVKNKFANSRTTTLLHIMYNEGIDWAGEILDLAVEFSICHRLGDGFFYGNLQIGSGIQPAREFLLHNQSIAREIAQAVRHRFALVQRLIEN